MSIVFRVVSPWYMVCCDNCGAVVGGSKTAKAKHAAFHQESETSPLEPETEEMANWGPGRDNYGSLS